MSRWNGMFHFLESGIQMWSGSFFFVFLLGLAGLGAGVTGLHIFLLREKRKMLLKNKERIEEYYEKAEKCMLEGMPSVNFFKGGVADDFRQKKSLGFRLLSQNPRRIEKGFATIKRRLHLFGQHFILR